MRQERFGFNQPEFPPVEQEMLDTVPGHTKQTPDTKGGDGTNKVSGAWLNAYL
jgi:hypothetical protein